MSKNSNIQILFIQNNDAQKLKKIAKRTSKALKTHRPPPRVPSQGFLPALPSPTTPKRVNFLSASVSARSLKLKELVKFLVFLYVV